MAGKTEEKIDWVAVSEALHGQRNAGELTDATRKQYREIAAEGVGHAPEPSIADTEAEQFWTEVAELEIASDEAGEHGTPEHDEWCRQIRELGS